MATTKFAVALHAGTSDTWNSDASHQQEVEKILKSVAETAGARLSSGAKALDVVQMVVTSLEDCPLFNAGKGAVLNEDGEHESEAAIADGTSGAHGAVAATRHVKNPIVGARAVLERGQNSSLVGAAADEFARESGVAMVSSDYFAATAEKTRWEARAGEALDASEDLETVGAVALDVHGNLAAASSIGGLTCKMNGRIGDSATIGAGLFVDQDVAVVWLVSGSSGPSVRVLGSLTSIYSSGAGEDVLRHFIAGKAAVLGGAESLDEAMVQVMLKKAEKAPSACAMVALNPMGHIAFESSGRVFPVASCTAFSSMSSVLPTIIHLFSQHMIYQDTLVAAGLTRYPTTPSHAVVVCRGVDRLMSLPLPTFLRVMHTVRQISVTLNIDLSTHRCGMTCDGSGILSLIPLHGVSNDWKAIVHDEKEYNISFPGYLTSKNGPTMEDALLEEIRSRIAATTKIVEPFNNYFDGEASDQNIFARIIRGEVPQWRIWEDEAHVAFLTPFGNTPGFTVLVPRKHLGSDVFGLEDQAFSSIVEAAHVVAQHLKKAFGVTRCGIFFEGYEIDYTHAKLIPVHDHASQGQFFTAIAPPIPFENTYQGFLTTQFGPRASDLGSMADRAKRLRELHAQRDRVLAHKVGGGREGQAW